MSEFTAVIKGDLTNLVLAYAARELRDLLAQTTSVRFLDDGDASAGVIFDLRVDDTLPQKSWSVRTRKSPDGGLSVTLAGQDAACVLHAVYTMLERVGICFDMAGPILPDSADLGKLEGWSADIQPAVLNRGIRQHINFTMDISSYPLWEAREYIRNLARLRFNHITFHSYTKQWFACDLPDQRILAGSFFYGTRYDIPDHPVVKPTLRNRKVFCIPEIELAFDDPEAKSRLAMEWLGSVMDQAKAVGMTVQLSIEPPGESIEDGLRACRAVLESYPQIDVLELITPEQGGNLEVRATEEHEALIRGLFGEDALGVPQVEKHIGSAGICTFGVVMNVGRNIRLATELKSALPDGPELAVGFYTSCPASQQIAYELMRRYCPEDISFTTLTEYGGRAVAWTVEAMELTPDDWARTLVYSWTELDGFMYLQQNMLVGTQQLLQLGLKATSGRPLRGIAFNHWQTLENRTALRYAALACIDGSLTPEDFYRGYAASLGIASVSDYVAAMQQLDDTDVSRREKAFNAGFCILEAWLMSGSMPGALPAAREFKWSVDGMREINDVYRSVRRRLMRCLQGTSAPEGRRYLRFLDNRLACSDLHMQAVTHLMHLAALDDKPLESLDDADRAQVIERCRAARDLAEQYLKLRAEAIPDRAGEGTLISYLGVFVPYVNYVERYFTGKGRDARMSINVDCPFAPLMLDK